MQAHRMVRWDGEDGDHGAAYMQADGSVCERALAAACRRKEPAALQCLIDRYTPAIARGVAAALGRYRDKRCYDRRDLVQDVFVRILQDPEKRLSKRLRCLSSWLETLARRYTSSRLRACHSPAHDRMQTISDLDTYVGSSGGLTLEQVGRTLNGLSDASHQIVDLHLKGNSCREIAAKLGMSIWLIYRKMAALKRRIMHGDFFSDVT